MRIILYSFKVAKSELSSVITKFTELINMIAQKIELTYNIETFDGYKASVNAVNAHKEEMKTLRASMRTLSEKFDKMDNYSLSEKFDKIFFSM